jgi:hypothetical protein
MGEVTLATPSRHLHRNGQLRFLFERVQVPDQAATPLVGALYAVEASADDRVALDDEGGATVTNSNTRFIAPTLALLALHASIERDGHEYADPDGDGTMKGAGSGVGARGFYRAAGRDRVVRLRRRADHVRQRSGQGTRSRLPREHTD